MKKIIFLIIVIVLGAASCKTKKQAEYTILGNYTPYQMYMEKLNGKVEVVTETNYWAVTDGESYKKGEKMTIKDLYSLGYTGDFEATFDNVGDLVRCAWLDENKKVLSKWEISKEVNRPARADNTENDTMKYYNKLKYNDKGELKEIKVFTLPYDTLLYTCEVTLNAGGDTMTYQGYNYKGEPGGKTLMVYNTSGQFTGFQQYNKAGSFMGGNELKYNDKGMASEVRFIDRDRNATVVNDFT